MFLVPFSPASRTARDFAHTFERLLDDGFERGAKIAQRSPALDVAET